MHFEFTVMKRLRSTERFYTFSETKVRFVFLTVSVLVSLLCSFIFCDSHLTFSGADDLILQFKPKLCFKSCNFVFKLIVELFIF